MKSTPHISASWDRYLAGEFELPYMQELFAFLQSQESARIYPARENWFAAFEQTPFDDVRVVILGQDPYHGPGQAHGLSFSVPFGEKVPPSLRNIYKELNSDLGMGTPEHGCLTSWAKQGVLLLNATLTVEEKTPGSHQNRGWEQFTDAAIEALNTHRQNLVFMLWGKYAQDKGAGIDTSRHLVLEARHPSPFSAYRGFFGCQHFSKTNAYLEAHQQQAIDWRLPDALPNPKAQIGFDFSTPSP
ncbi:uracil-DNA glycosylase [Mariprofundus micogutta]|uniref:uracil-DNA glycosylase n=1 Tax=Mariprofundus micogutta TaxID=1921010 RepID=UPI001D11DBC7|nr:uracil-DNA glycosylase [Mariprofundus micogutta]